jgi:hypothetical protein
MKSPFRGHTLFIWQVKQCTKGLPANSPEARAHIWAVMQKAEIFNIFPKVANGTSPYNLTPVGTGWKDDILPAVFAMLAEKKRPKVGWHYVYGFNPIGEAEMSARRILELGLDALIIDGEAEYKLNGNLRAGQYMNRLRQLCPATPVALCSYRYPSYHPSFPWKGFLDNMDVEHGDVHMPQVYWIEATDKEAGRDQLVKSYVELDALESLPIIPVGAAWGEKRAFGWWDSTYEQMVGFGQEAIDLACPGVSWWDWDKLQEQDGVTPDTSKLRRWDAIRWVSSKWSAEEEPGTEPGPQPQPELDTEEKVDVLWREAGGAGWNLTL